MLAPTLFTFSANAAVVFDSTGNNQDDDWEISSFGSASQLFTSDSEAGVISGLKLNFYYEAFSVATYTAQLFSDNSGAPGALLGTIATGSLTHNSAFNLYDVSLALNQPTLAASTKYWITISTTNDGYIFWGSTSGFDGTGVAANHTLYHDGIYPYSNECFLMQVSVSAVPEPSPLALAALGGLGMLWQYRRRK